MLIEREVLVPWEEKAYSAFPTFVTCGDALFVYYRKGVTHSDGGHGKRGRVHSLRINKRSFLRDFGQIQPLNQLGEDEVVFEDGNEMDAIVSQLAPDRFSLATRNYDDAGVMRTYISFNNRPEFNDRNLVEFEELDWFAFYGKAFHANGLDIFPAYGSLKWEIFGRPLLLSSQNGSDWKLLAVLPSYFDKKTVLNESSVAWDGHYWVMFMRQDTKPFGLWLSRSKDLLEWSPPKKWRDQAHAPMALNINGTLHLCFRNILGEDRAAFSLVTFSENASLPNVDNIIDLDEYTGSIYDGGYGDLGLVGDDLFVFYYHGNVKGEPFLKAARLKYHAD